MRRRWPRWLWGLLLPGCAVPAHDRGPQALPPDREAQVVCVVEAMPNYLLHLAAIAGVPYPSAYGEAFAGTVAPEDLELLRRHAALLQWGPSGTGDLAPFLVLLPTYLRFGDEFELAEYLRLLDEGIRSGAYAPVRDRYHDAHQRLSWWLFDYEGFFTSRAETYREYLPVVRALVQVYEHNYRHYEEEVWRQVEPELDLLAGDLNGRLWSLDLVTTWERLTGLRFRGDRFEVLLAAAPGGTGMTGLGYECSLLSSDVERQRIPGLITRQVGVHLLVELFREASARDAAAGQLDWTTYAAYEGLALHYTRQIAPGFQTEIENDVETFAGIYRQLQDEEPHAGARRLLGRGLAQYRAGRR